MQKIEEGKKTFLEIIIDVLELTMRSSTVDIIKAQIAKNLEEDLKDYEDIPFISIKDPSLAIDETFYKYIMKELKYLLIHNKEDFVLRTSRNTVIYLLCKILNSLNKYESKLVNQKEIVHIYIAITSSFIGGQSENEENLLSLFFYLYPRFFADSQPYQDILLTMIYQLS